MGEDLEKVVGKGSWKGRFVSKSDKCLFQGACKSLDEGIQTKNEGDIFISGLNFGGQKVMTLKGGSFTFT